MRLTRGAKVETTSFFTGLFESFTHPIPWISLILAILGIFLAYAMYSAKWVSPQKIGEMFKPLYRLLFNKYWMDYLYENLITRVALIGKLFAGFQWIDINVVDGIANDTASGTVGGGKVVQKTETGQLQLYALLIGLGIVAIAIIVFIFGR